MATSQKLSLKEWMDAVGVDAYDLAKRAGVTMQTISQAEKKYGTPISLKKAEAICAELSKEHGKPIRVSDVRDLETI